MKYRKSLICPLLLFIWTLKSHGDFPFVLKENPDGGVGVTVSKLQCAYGLFLITASTISSGVFCSRIEGTSVIDYFYGGYAIVSSTATLVAYLHYLYEIKNIRKIFERAYSYFEYIDDRNIRVKIFLITFAEIFAYEGYYTLGICLTEFLELSGNPKDKGLLVQILDFFCEYYYLFVLSALSCQFGNVLLVFRKTFRVINWELEDYLQEQAAASVSYVQVKEDKNCRRELIDENGDLTILFDLFNDVCDFCQRINDSFGFTMVVTVFAMFIQVLGSIYTFIETKFLAEFVVWFGYHLLHFWFILYACEINKKEVQRTGILIHNLIAQTRDPRLKEQLELFSNQLLFRKVEFTACGLFPLNYTLIYSVAGACTTYIVILIQFQISADDED